MTPVKHLLLNIITVEQILTLIDKNYCRVLLILFNALLKYSLNDNLGQ